VLCTEKIRKQAGKVFTPPPPPLQNYQEVEYGSIETLNENGESLKQKSVLSVIARLSGELATKFGQECTSRRDWTWDM